MDGTQTSAFQSLLNATAAGVSALLPAAPLSMAQPSPLQPALLKLTMPLDLSALPPPLTFTEAADQLSDLSPQQESDCCSMLPQNDLSTPVVTRERTDGSESQSPDAQAAGAAALSPVPMWLRMSAAQAPIPPPLAADTQEAVSLQPSMPQGTQSVSPTTQPAVMIEPMGVTPTLSSSALPQLSWPEQGTSPSGVSSGFAQVPPTPSPLLPSQPSPTLGGRGLEVVIPTPVSLEGESRVGGPPNQLSSDGARYLGADPYNTVPNEKAAALLPQASGDPGTAADGDPADHPHSPSPSPQLTVSTSLEADPRAIAVHTAEIGNQPSQAPSPLSVPDAAISPPPTPSPLSPVPSTSAQLPQASGDTGTAAAGDPANHPYSPSASPQLALSTPPDVDPRAIAVRTAALEAEPPQVSSPSVEPAVGHAAEGREVAASIRLPAAPVLQPPMGGTIVPPAHGSPLGGEGTQLDFFEGDSRDAPMPDETEDAKRIATSKTPEPSPPPGYANALEIAPSTTTARPESPHTLPPSGSGQDLNPTPTITQLVERIHVAIKDGRQELQMVLSPEHLGTVRVEISAVDGDMKARLTVDNPLAKAVIEENLYKLKEALVVQGVHIQDIAVSVGQHFTRQESAAGNLSSGGRPWNPPQSHRPAGMAEEISGAPNSLRSSMGSTLVDLFV